jgi:hypothetical protein
MMKITMKMIVLIIAFIVTASCIQAQILHPVKWSYAARKTATNTAFVYIKAAIDEGWQIYSIHQKVGGPVKTSFSFVPSGTYALLGDISEPKPQNEYNKVFAMKVLYFEKVVIFQQKIGVSKSPTVVKGSINFMACNDQKCLPPEDFTFEIPIK